VIGHTQATMEIFFGGETNANYEKWSSKMISGLAAAGGLHARLLDQPALQGLLQRIAALGLELVDVSMVRSPPAG
jgi:hypothetical protein